MTIICKPSCTAKTSSQWPIVQALEWTKQAGWGSPVSQLTWPAEASLEIHCGSLLGEGKSNDTIINITIQKIFIVKSNQITITKCNLKQIFYSRLEPITFFSHSTVIFCMRFDFLFLHIMFATFPGNLCRYMYRTDQIYFQTDKPPNR